MKALFFPFTHMRQIDADLILSCFDQASLFCVSSPEELDRDSTRFKDGIGPIPLSAQVLKPVKNAIKAYRSWAELHGGKPGSLKAVLRDTPYFTSDTDVAALKSGIQKGSRTGIPAGEIKADSNQMQKEDSLTQSLVFLRLAQEADLENEIIDRQIASLEKTKADLFSGIKGDDVHLSMPGNPVSAIDPGRRSAEDSGRIMTEKRMAAWAVLFKAASDLLDSRKPLFLVTTSTAVWDYLEANAKKFRKVLDIDMFKVHERNCKFWSQWQTMLMDAVTRSAAGEEPADTTLVSPEATPDDSCPLTAGLKVSIFSGGAIREMLCSRDGQGSNQVLFQEREFEIPVCLISPK